MMTTGFARWSIPFALLPLSAATLSAQSTGTIRGLLKDPSGNSMPGVHVRLLSNATQQQSETLSTDAGTYVFTFLAPGAYQLSAEAPGFKRYVHDNVTVEVAGTTTLDPVLELGQVTEQVDVQSQVQQVDTSSSALGGVVEQKMVTGVPLSSRNFTQILSLSPGVNSGVPNAGALGRNSVNISANGARPFDNTLILNGLLAENPMSQGSTTTSINPAFPFLLRTHSWNLKSRPGSMMPSSAARVAR